MMLEKIFVFLIVGSAALYLLRYVRKLFENSEKCACGCSSCSIGGSCAQLSDKENHSEKSKHNPWYISKFLLISGTLWTYTNVD